MRKQRPGKKSGYLSALCELNEDKAGYIYLLVLILLLAIISVNNWLYLEQNINSDIAGEYLYMQKVWETKNPFTSAYANSMESFISRPWLIFMLFYSIGQDLIISTKLTIIATTILMALSTAFLLRKMQRTLTEILLALSVFFGLLTSGLGIRWILYRYFNAYSIFYIGLTIILGLLIDAQRNGRLRPVQKLIYYGLAFYFGVCGPRMLLTLYVPAILVELFLFARDRFAGIKTKCGMAKFGIGGGANLLGLFLYKAFMSSGTQFDPAFSLMLTPTSSIWKEIESELTNLFYALRLWIEEVPLLSTDGICYLYMLLTVILLIVGGIWLARKHFIPEADCRILLYLLSAGACWFVFLLFTDIAGADRYYFFLPLAGVIVVVLLYRYLYERLNLKFVRRLYSCMLMAGILLLTVDSYDLSCAHAAPSPGMALVEYLQSTGQRRIAGTYWNVNSLSFLSNGKIDGVIVQDTESLPMHDWLIDRDNFLYNTDPMTFVLTGAERDTWMSGEKRGHLLSLADDVSEYAGYCLYHYDNAPLQFSLLEYGKKSQYNFLSLIYDGNVALENGCIVLHPDAVQGGPYCSAPAGEYNVVVRGEGFESGYFFCCTDGGLKVFELKDLVIAPEEVSYTISLDTETTSLEFGCRTTSDQTITIRDITVTPFGE